MRHCRDCIYCRGFSPLNPFIFECGYMKKSHWVVGKHAGDCVWYAVERLIDIDDIFKGLEEIL